MTTKRKFSFGPKPSSRPREQAPLQAGIREDVAIPEGPPPELSYTGKTRYARVFDAMRALEAGGFEDGLASDEMVSTSGHFARIETLTKATDGPCDVHVRRAMMSY